MLGKQNTTVKIASDACSLLKKYTLSDRVGRTPEFINYQLWTSYKTSLSLKYLFHFFLTNGWLHFLQEYY